MPFSVPLRKAQEEYPQYTFVKALTPSEQKAAFHVTDEQGHDLCLKIISPDYDSNRLHREILALQSLEHPNVAKLKEYTFSSKAGQQKHFIVEEYIEGHDLSGQLGPSQRWPRRRAAQFFAALCDGLDAARRLKIVHRDLKPTNIRVRKNGAPVIIDFGVARHLDLPDITCTKDGAQIGTPMYFAPEQFMGTKYDIDHRTDLFAVGVLLYQSLVGAHPFNEAGISLRDAVCKSEGYRHNQVFGALPDEWKLLINKLLAKDRGSRPHNAAQVAKILRKIGGD